MIVWDLIYSLSEPDFRISFQENYHESSNFPDCRYFTKLRWPYFGSAWRYSQMVGQWARWYYRYCACWYDLDLIQGQGKVHGAFELTKISEAVHYGGNDRQPPCGALWFYCCFYVRMMSPVPCALKLMKHRVIWSLLFYWRLSTWLGKWNLFEVLLENFHESKLIETDFDDVSGPVAPTWLQSSVNWWPLNFMWWVSLQLNIAT